MEDQKRHFLSAALVLVLLVTVAVAYGPLKEQLNRNQTMGEIDMDEVNDSQVSTVFLDGNRTLAELQLETADTPEERAEGLMGRRSLENGTGMLFIWEDSANRSFWMKNTYIPLDMIFVTAEKTVRTIKEANPEPNVSDEELKIYTSEGPARYVIETRQNFTDEKGIEEGNTVSFNLSG